VTETLHIYTRVSTSVQELEGTSISTQQELGIKKSVELGLKYKIWDEGGQSSNKDDLTNRPVLTRLLEEVKTGDIKHLFVFNTDRLSRNEQTWSFIRLRLVQNDVRLYTSNGFYNLNNQLDKMMLGILSEISSYDNYLRTERTRLGKFKKIKQGFWMGGPTPFGYQVVEKKLVPNEDESKWVKFIFESYKDGKTIRHIKNELLRNGVLTRRGNSVWTLGSIEKLLTNSHYGGFYFVKDHKTDEVIRVECPSILSSSLVHQVNLLKQSRTRQTRISESNQKNFYLLREFLFCGECDSRYSGRIYPTQYRSVYYCPRNERNYVNEQTGKTVKCLNRRYLKIEETDKLVWDSVVDVMSKSHLFKEEVKNQVLGTGQSYESQKDEIKKTKNKLKKIETEIRDVTNSIVNLETDQILKKRSSSEVKSILENVEKVRQKLESDRDSLNQQIYSLENRTSWIDWINEFGKRINKMSDFSTEEKSKFLKGVVEKIVVHTVDKQKHELKINFRLPYVGDTLVRNTSKTTSSKFKVKKGKVGLNVRLEPSKK
jgi:DNA invertase Pin-like site-specific DNA recombinase